MLVSREGVLDYPLLADVQYRPPSWSHTILHSEEVEGFLAHAALGAEKRGKKALTDPKMRLGWDFLLITRPIFTMHELNTTWFNFSFHTSEYPNKGNNCWYSAVTVP